MAPVTILFSDHAIAPPVYVAGSFSEWKPIGLDSAWYQNEFGEDRFAYQKVFDIEPGVYQYKFRLGPGDWWVCDSQCLQARDPHGNENNLLIVEKKSLEGQPSDSHDNESFATPGNHGATGLTCTNCSKDNAVTYDKPSEALLDRRKASCYKGDVSPVKRLDDQSAAARIGTKALAKEKSRQLGPEKLGDGKLRSPRLATPSVDDRRRSGPSSKQMKPEPSVTRIPNRPTNHTLSGSGSTRKPIQPVDKAVPDSPIRPLQSRAQTLLTRTSAPDPTNHRHPNRTLDIGTVKRTQSQPINRLEATETHVRRASTQPTGPSLPWSSGRLPRSKSNRTSLQMSTIFDDRVDWTPVPLDKKSQRQGKKKAESKAARVLDATKSVLLLTAAAFTGPVVFALYWKKEDNVSR